MPQPDVLTFCRELVRLPSCAGEEDAVAQAVAARMGELAFDHVSIDAWGNVIGEVRGALPGPRLLVDAHMDTVPAGEESAWTRPPFAAEIAGDRLYGRGTADDKGGLSAIVTMVERLDRSRLAGTLFVSGTVNEEVSEGAGLAKVCEAVRPDCVLIAEGTGLALGIGQKGRASVLVEADGVPAHTSNPGVGVNAVYRALPALLQLRTLPLRTHPILGSELAELVELISTPYPSNSVVPYHCLARYDARLLPGDTPEALVQRWQAVAGSHVRISVRRQTFPCYTGAALDFQDFYPAWLTPPDSPFLAAARSGLDRVGQHPPDYAAHYCTNGSYSGGIAGIPTLIYGPGLMQNAHIVEEYVDIPQLEQAVEGFAAIVQETLS